MRVCVCGVPARAPTKSTLLIISERQTIRNDSHIATHSVAHTISHFPFHSVLHAGDKLCECVDARVCVPIIRLYLCAQKTSQSIRFSELDEFHFELFPFIDSKVARFVPARLTRHQID